MLPHYSAKLLVVDDQPAILQLVEYMLGSGYELSKAYDGEQALEILKDQKFDLILMDIMMPGISGMDVLKKIREKHAPLELPVILMSALSDGSDIERGLQQLANDYITKPMKASILRARVQTQLHMKHLADEHHKLVAQLEEANTIQRNLMRIASHDLKSPLHNLSLVHDLLEEHLVPSPEAQRLMNIAHTGTNTMLSIIQEFLELDVVRGDKLQIEIEPVSAAYVLSIVILELQTLAAAKNIAIETTFPDDTVLADARRLKQVLNNLISNAIKYGPPNSTININAIKQDGFLEIHVIDQGVGIPAEEHKMLFEPFSKISTRPTGDEHSTGLGLWIAKQMMKAQGGNIGITTHTERMGSDFWIRIPCAPHVVQKAAI